ASYTLTAPDGSRNLIGPRGIFEHDTADGHVLHISDAGITAQNGDTLRLVHDDQGRIAAAQTPSGVTVNYVYDAAGHLAKVVHSTNGTLDRYGYDASSGTISLAIRAGSSQAYLPGQPALALTGDLGTPGQFDNTPIVQTLPAGGEHDY